MSAATLSSSLTGLSALAPDRLYVFVAGPGLGEGIAIALPGAGWVLIDGCKTSDRYPLREIFTRFRRGAADPIDCFVWTHPHLDHSEGVAQLVAEERPRRLAITGANPKQTLLTEFERLSAASRAVTSDAQKTMRVSHAIEAIMRSTEDDPSVLLPLHDGVPVPLSTKAALHLTARAPESAALGAWLAAQAALPDFFHRVNELSAVLELTFGATRLVLGGDLPRFRAGGKKAVPTGWDAVLQHHPQLGQHLGLKLPHHGSPEAYHPDLHTQARGRSWWVTPYNSSGLPSVADLEGLPRLLKREPAIELTALPASRALQVALGGDGRVSLKQLVPRTPGRRRGGIKLQEEALYLKPEKEPEPLEPIWCAEFDDQGNITARFRGAVALEVSA